MKSLKNRTQIVRVSDGKVTQVSAYTPAKALKLYEVVKRTLPKNGQVRVYMVSGDPNEDVQYSEGDTFVSCTDASSILSEITSGF